MLWQEIKEATDRKGTKLEAAYGWGKMLRNTALNQSKKLHTKKYPLFLEKYLSESTY